MAKKPKTSPCMSQSARDQQPSLEGVFKANRRLRKRALAAQVRLGHDTIAMVTAMRRRKAADKQDRTIAELRALPRQALDALRAAGVRPPRAYAAAARAGWR